MKNVERNLDLFMEWYNSNEPKENASIHLEMYLSWANDFISLDKFADFYAIPLEKADEVINYGRNINEIFSLCIVDNALKVDNNKWKERSTNWAVSFTLKELQEFFIEKEL
jgi:hypothetical protein